MIEEIITLYQHVGLLTYVFFFLSITGVSIICERMFYFARLGSPAQSNTLASLNTILRSQQQVAKSLRDDFIDYKLTEVTTPYYDGIRFLRLIAMIAPMIGLFGTVIGIIDSFHIISQHDGPVYPSLIAEGLWQAMITTALGLGIALPCLFFAFVFARIAEKRIQHYQLYLNQVSFELEGIK